MWAEVKVLPKMCKGKEKKRRHQKRSLQAGLGWAGPQQGQRPGMCFKPVEHIAETSPATAVPEIASRESHTTLQ